MENNFDSLGSAGLSRLLGADSEDTPAWSTAELSQILHHQLQAPLNADGELHGIAMSSADPQTYAELLFAPTPRTVLLESVTNFAKQSGQSVAPPFPKAIAAVLYIAAISAAFVSSNSAISDVRNPSFLKKLEWATAQPWLTEETKDLLTRMKEKLG